MRFQINAQPDDASHSLEFIVDADDAAAALGMVLDSGNLPDGLVCDFRITAIPRPEPPPDSLPEVEPGVLAAYRAGLDLEFDE